MTPPPFSRIHLNTGWVAQKVPLRCTLMTLSQLASLALAKVSSSRMPALLTRMSARPKFLMASSNTACAARQGRDVGAVGDGAAALGLDRRDHLLGHRQVGAGAIARTAEVIDHDRRTLARKQFGIGLAQPAARAGDQRHLAVEESHGSLPDPSPSFRARNARARRLS